MAENASLELIDRQEWLDPVADELKKSVRAAFGAAGESGRKVKNALHGTWLGHPLHPVLTDVPLGAWTTALALDIMEARGARKFAPGADGAVAVGLAGAVGAAVSGLTDWNDIDGKPRRYGLVHGLLNVTGTLLYATSLLLRRRNSRNAGRCFAFAGFGVAMAAAYLGGNLVYGDQIGVNHAAGPEPSHDFVPVLPDAELRENELRRVETNGMRVLLARHQGVICALAETCSHLGGPLAEGQLEGDSVRCPWHGSRFALEDGSVLDGPATHPQPCFETRIRNGQIEIRSRIK